LATAITRPHSLDFFLWGHIKSLVYETPVETQGELIARILAACLVVRQTPGIFERVRQNFLRRCTTCIEAGGRHFEQLLCVLYHTVRIFFI
jgi:hypothetical protein